MNVMDNRNKRCRQVRNFYISLVHVCANVYFLCSHNFYLYTYVHVHCTYPPAFLRIMLSSLVVARERFARVVKSFHFIRNSGESTGRAMISHILTV